MLSTRKSTKSRTRSKKREVSEDEAEGTKYQKHVQHQRKRNQQVLVACIVTATVIIIIHTFKRESQVWTKETKFLSPVKHKSHDGKYRWADPRMLPPLPGEDVGTSKMLETLHEALQRKKGNKRGFNKRKDFQTSYGFKKMYWEDAAEAHENDKSLRQGPLVDYTKWKYSYPKLLNEVPRDGSYPPLKPLGEIIKNWPQDDLDNPPEIFKEELLHFDYMDLDQRATAIKFRDYELPFKVYNVPELAAANVKWTDDYLSSHFDSMRKTIHGTCQESDDNFFSFFRNENWRVEVMGPPPSLDNDLSFKTFAKHARYADNVGLAASEKHLYWQSGVPKQERHKKKSQWSFVSLDLPSFSDPEPTFFGFNPPEQKGIQCRFGERGVTAATHYDAGRNMVAMITGAKRYILSPPKACPELGIIAENKHPAFRHSLLNFEHLNLLEEGSEITDMSEEERAWLEISYNSKSVDTILKAGEVLYIPSHWFHYITSLQKSAQCNTRSGRHIKGSKEFGGFNEIHNCIGSNA